MNSFTSVALMTYYKSLGKLFSAKSKCRKIFMRQSYCSRYSIRQRLKKFQNFYFTCNHDPGKFCKSSRTFFSGYNFLKFVSNVVTKKMHTFYCFILHVTMSETKKEILAAKNFKISVSDMAPCKIYIKHESFTKTLFISHVTMAFNQ